MGVPLWVTDSHGSIRYLNARAEALFGCTLAEWHARPCHLMIRGRTRAGAVCCPRCRVRVQSETGREIEPVRMRIAGAPELGEVGVVVIAVETPQGRLLVHCIVDDARERRVQRFLDGVMSRTRPPDEGAHDHDAVPDSNGGIDTGERGASPRPTLTTREREILSLLATDATLQEIANNLSVSHTTIRNHVQHILSKLGVHSILEAVAVWMLEGEEI